ncbi:hypothetical protein Tco_0051451 [Tanacetum coccineum]
MEHEASSSQAHQMNPEEQIESEINFWFDEDTWNQAEREISPDEVLAKEEEESLSYGKKMEYKSYLSTKGEQRASGGFCKSWKLQEEEEAMGVLRREKITLCEGEDEWEMFVSEARVVEVSDMYCE